MSATTALLWMVLTAAPYGDGGAGYQAAFDDPSDQRAEQPYGYDRQPASAPAAIRQADDVRTADSSEPWPEPRLLPTAGAARGPASSRLPLGFGPAPVGYQQTASAPVEHTAAQERGAEPLRLAPPNEEAGGVRRLPTASLTTVLASLGVVVGLFLVLAMMVRRGMPKGSTNLPSGVIEVLGRTPLAGRHQLHLIRLGHKLVLVSASQGGVETIAEVTDPLEVDRLTGLCYQTHPNGATASFRQVFDNFGGEPTRATANTKFSDLESLARGMKRGPEDTYGR